MWLYKNQEIKELTDMPENTFGFQIFCDIYNKNYR